MENSARLFDASRMAAAVCLAVMMLACAVARAQEDEKPPEPRPADVPNLPDVLKEGTLELKARLYLPDGKGDPRFVPNMRLGDLLDMERAQASRSEGADLPTYAFDELKVTARVGAEVADIAAHAKITLSENAMAVTQIGLRLQSCQLSEPITFEGDGKSQWQVGSKEPGYIWWLKAEPNTSHVATLIGQSVVVSEGDRQSLPLSLPAAPVTIEAYLPANCQDVRVRGQGDELLRSESNNGEHKVIVRCTGGDVNISWRSGSDGKPVAGAAEATSNTRLRIADPREAWDGETTLTVQAYGQSPVDTLTVELPEGAEWLPTPSSTTEQFTIEELPSTVPAAPSATPTRDAPTKAEPAKGEAAKAQAQGRDRVRLSVRAQAPTGLSKLESISIRWRWMPQKTGDEVSLSNISVPSITVRAVDRHDGTMELVIPTGYRLDWKSQPGTELDHQMRVVDIQEQWHYRFRFSRQPLGLVASFRREVNLAEVRPLYLAEVDPRWPRAPETEVRGNVKLTGWLDCAFDRSQRPELALALGDWALQSAQVISDMSDPYAEGQLLSQQALGSGFVKLSNDIDTELVGSGRRQRQLWRIVANRSLNEGSIEHLKLTVPGIVLLAPDGSRVAIEHATGVLLMAASENVLISWDERNSQSLLTDAVSSEWASLQLPERASAYRFQAGADKSPIWSGRVEVLPRRIAADQIAEVKIDVDAARISQKFSLQIANEPLQRLQLVTHGALDGSVLVNGVPCVLESTAPDPEAPEDQTLLTVVGAPKLIGKVEVEVRSQLVLPTATQESAESIIKLPLVKLDLPDALVASRAKVNITADRRLNVSIGNPQVTTEVSSAIASGAAAAWSPLPDGPIDIPAGDEPLQLRIRHLDEVDPLPVRVSGAWMQTAVNGSTRLDRFCARFQTQQAYVSLVLPAPDLLSTEVAIDGLRIDRPVDNGQGQLQLDIRDLQPDQEHTLEVWTRSATTLGWLNAIDVVPITIKGCEQFDHFYWQLITPSNQHLVHIPDSVTAEWRWVWDRLWWHRLSPQDQSFFEQWLDATEQQPLAESANRYVVSSYGPVDGFRCWTASRLLLWLPTGLVAIACALAVSVWRRLRHPGSVIILAVLLSMLAAAWPDLAILVGQTMLLALLIVLLYALTQAAIESRVRRRSVFTTRPTSAMLESGDHHSQVRPGSQVSSQVMPTTRTQSPIVADGGGQ